MKKVMKSWLVLSVVSVHLLAMVGCSAKPVEMPHKPGDQWRLVVIGDSSMWELGKAYAAQIERDLGVKVTLDDFALPSLSAGSVRQALETGTSQNMRLELLPDAVKDAEVVIMFVNPTDSVDPAVLSEMEGCFGGSKPGKPQPAAFDPYITDLQAIWAKIIEMRAGQPTVLYATDLYNPLVGQWNSNNIFSNCDGWWAAMSAANRKAAEAFNIPFLSRYDAFNGADHSEDPRGKGYIRDDGEHPTELAAQVTAELLSKMGYYAVTPVK